MESSSRRLPFTELGKQLKAIRNKLHESLIDVSGAVELDVADLQRFESGAERPNEDILMMLISHFNVQDDDAVDLWQMAGYEQSEPIDEPTAEIAAKTITIMMALDTRILYTDNVQITVNKKGVVLTFLQNTASDQSLPVAKVGMSYEQTGDLLKALQNTLLKAEVLRRPKNLPTSDQVKKKSDKDWYN